MMFYINLNHMKTLCDISEIELDSEGKIAQLLKCYHIGLIIPFVVQVAH